MSEFICMLCITLLGNVPIFLFGPLSILPLPLLHLKFIFLSVPSLMRLWSMYLELTLSSSLQSYLLCLIHSSLLFVNWWIYLVKNQKCSHASTPQTGLWFDFLHFLKSSQLQKLNHGFTESVSGLFILSSLVETIYSLPPSPEGTSWGADSPGLLSWG